jgi:ABC-type amino acid transport substrate-binding protein
MIIRKHFLIPLFLLCFAFANRQSYASEKALFSLTAEEKAWLAEHPEISIGIMAAWAPMNFMDETGTPDGIGVDYLKALNQRLDGVLTIQAGPFKENYSRVKDKKLDALMDITPKKEREPFFNFTKPYLTIPHVIAGRKDGLYFDSEKDLANKTIALEREARYNFTIPYLSMPINIFTGGDVTYIGDLNALEGKRVSAPIHPGAMKYYKEAGLTIPPSPPLP